MTLDDVVLLVEWKLRHGKFRPTLMGLASSNSVPLARKTIAAAIQAYRRAAEPSDAGSVVAAALKELTKLRGIGPATASLLLSVHDPDRVIFFSDEAFYWLCGGGGGRVGSIKYSNKEYDALRKRAGELVKRLGVSATNVEKVAYVLFKRDGARDAGADGKSEAASKVAKTTKAAKLAEEPAKESKSRAKSAKDTKSVKEAPPKRKSTAAKEDEPAPGTRRSKRVKK